MKTHKSKLRANKSRRKQRGGNQKHIVYYTCFFGPSGSVSDKIPNLPSKTYDCFYFTNNADASKRAAEVGWKVINSPVEVKESNRDNAMDSKELKACPHHFKELQGYTYSCYFDSKLHVKDVEVNDMLKGLHGDVVMLLNKHFAIKHAVKNEFDEAMKQPRYAQNKKKYENHIQKKLANGAKNRMNVHYETGFILRKCGELVDTIGEEWYEDIKNTGAECQITFFFIQQKYKNHVKPIAKYYGRENYKHNGQTGGSKPFVIIQYEDRPLSEGDNGFINRNKEYCKRHGYEHILKKDGYTDLPPWWRKVRLVKDILSSNKYRGCLWLDTDACIYDMNIKLESLAEDNFDFYKSGEKPSENGNTGSGLFFNAGAWLVMNTPVGNEIMNKWMNLYNSSKWTNEGGKWKTNGTWSGPDYEQGSFVDNILPVFINNINSLDYKFFNSLDEGPGVFIVHYYLGKHRIPEFLARNPL